MDRFQRSFLFILDQFFFGLVLFSKVSLSLSLPLIPNVSNTSNILIIKTIFNTKDYWVVALAHGIFIHTQRETESERKRKKSVRISRFRFLHHQFYENDGNDYHVLNLYVRRMYSWKFIHPVSFSIATRLGNKEKRSAALSTLYNLSLSLQCVSEKYLLNRTILIMSALIETSVFTNATRMLEFISFSFFFLSLTLSLTFLSVFRSIYFCGIVMRLSARSNKTQWNEREKEKRKEKRNI